MGSTANRINSRNDAFDDQGLPAGYSLEQLVVLHRHGERHVVVGRFPEVPLDLSGACARTRSYSVVRTGGPTGGTELKFEERSLDGPAHPAQQADDCALGQLTDRGATTLEQLGANLRRRYVDQIAFLPKSFSPAGVLVQSTDIPRAMASARFLLSGLYPPQWRAPGDVPALHVRKPEHEVIYPNYACSRLRAMGEVWRRSGTLQADMDEFKEATNPVLFGLAPPPPRVDGVPGSVPQQSHSESVLPSHGRSTHAFFDENAVRRAHDQPLLPGTTPDSLAKAEALSVREWFGHYDGATKTAVCRLGMGPLFRDLVEQMTSKTPRQAVLYSGHDTSLVPFMSCLGAFDGKWPKYGANVILEVLKKNGTSDKFVQLRYNFQRRALSDCARFAPKDAPTLCPMDRFLAIVKPLTPTPSEFEAECRKKA